MMNKLLEKILEKTLEKTLQFSEQEDGLALTEYLILLAVVAGAVITAATAFSTTLEAQWTALTSEIFDAL